MQSIVSRRSILASIGSLAAVSGVATGEESCNETSTCTDKHSCDEKRRHGVDGRVCTLPCYKPEETEKDCCSDEYKWAHGAITMYNCSDCTRSVRIRVTGEISPEENLTTDEAGELGSSMTTTLGSGAKETLWFTGELRTLDTDPGKINIAISQRSESEMSHCKR